MDGIKYKQNKKNMENQKFAKITPLIEKYQAFMFDCDGVIVSTIIFLTY